MRTKTKLVALALLGASTVITAPAMAEAAAAPNTAVSPFIYETTCTSGNTSDVRILLANSLGCVAFNGSGTASDLDLANAYTLSAGVWSGYVKYSVGGNLYTTYYQSGNFYSLPENSIVYEVYIK